MSYRACAGCDSPCGCPLTTPPSPDPGEMERVARAIWIEDDGDIWAAQCGHYRRLARAALAAARPATDVAALCDLTFRVVSRYVAGSTRNAIAMAVNRDVVSAALGITEDELRAALSGAHTEPKEQG